jgi:lipopolysaccharide/colanic/teichoic acid biosynthesis glycosyltransferase
MTISASTQSKERTSAWLAKARRVAAAAGKRTMDICFAILLLIVSTPLLLVSMLLVRTTSHGPALFRQERVGLDGRLFVMLKLRTMYAGCEDAIHQEYVRTMLAGEAVPTDGLYKLDGDARVTPIGAFLRRTSLDELPQLWNVIRGDMSLVGPRPALVWEAEAFPSWAHDRFGVRPGLTGLWQVSGRNRVTMVDGLHLDIRYVASRTLWMDLKILLRTAKVVLGADTR